MLLLALKLNKNLGLLMISRAHVYMLSIFWLVNEVTNDNIAIKSNNHRVDVRVGGMQIIGTNTTELSNLFVDIQL